MAQYTVSLGFTANTAQAKTQLQELQNQLTNLLKMPAGNNGFGEKLTKDLFQAQSAAAQLQASLQNATNVNTGKLDLGKFQQSMKSAGMSLEQYRDSLLKLGPEGQQAFMSLAQSIMNAEVPFKRANKLLSDFGTTLKNTAKWQISSSLLHGFMGAVQEAFGYAQDLNASLNDIRIVTGQSTDQMAEFAEKANKAAKSLSTTTTEYTKASLIYYQQGLSDTEVEERTNVTIKMANAAGESAEKVSDQLTAVWNNFYDGTKSLEYYADVMTALGAATASSTDEIAGGLEKFAAIGQTIGLSYEYAASALATITSNTRQSEEVVGTALKTIFARIQGLNLGETLDDGTTLNKYSEALQKVGISIFDSSGELKKMDTILDEMANKWTKLSKDQQVALAQTVAGVRQYTQLVALMENWDKGDSDSMVANLDTAYNSTGALQEQADIYADSWEAAQDRVAAAAESLYNDLIDDEFFITLLNSLEKILTFVDKIIDRMGGLKGVLAGVAALVFKVAEKQIATGLTNMAYSMSMMTSKGREKVTAEKDTAYSLASDMSYNTVTEEGAAQAQSMNSQIELQHTLIQNAERMTEEDLKRYQLILDANKAYGEQAILAAKAVDAAKAEHSDTLSETRNNIRRNGEDGDMEKFNTATSKMDEITRAGVEAQAKIDALFAGSKGRKGSGLFNDLEKIKTSLKDVGADHAAEEIEKLQKTMGPGNKRTEAFNKGLKELSKNGGILEEAMFDGAQAMEEYGGTVVVSAKEADRMAASSAKVAAAQSQQDKTTEALSNHTEQALNSIKNYRVSLNSLSTTIVNVAQGTTSLMMGINALSSIGDIDPNASAWEKFSSALMSLGMGLPMIIGGMRSLAETTQIANAIRMASLLGIKAETAEEQKNAVAKYANIAAKLLGVKTETAEKILTEALVASKGKLTVAALTEAAAENGVTLSKGAQIAATIAQTVANWALNASMSPVLLITLLITAALVVLIATIAIVVAAFEAWKNSTPEAKLAAAKEESARLTEELNKAKEASDSLRKSIEDYDSAVKKISELKEGTEEWRAAIEEANAKAREIIEQGGMEGKYSFNAETGLIEFGDGELEAAQEAADKQVKNIQAQKLMADNGVLRAETALNNKQVATNNDQTARTQNLVSSSDVNAIAGVVGALINPIGALTVAFAQGMEDKAQTKALEKLQEAYEKSEGNFVKAMDSLDPATKAMVESLGRTDEQLEAMCAASRANTQAILENNKQIVATQFEGNEAYDESSNKAYLNELLASDMTAETERLYEEQYKDGAGMSDKEAQKAYADLMGWDANLVKNKSGNKAVYINEEGEEVTISDEKARQYLAQQAALDGLNESVSDYAEKVEKLEMTEQNLVKQYKAGAISYDEYVRQMKKAGKELELSNEQIDMFINNHSDKSIQFSKKAQSKLGLKGYEADALSNHISNSFSEDDIINSEEAMDIALNVAATSSSLDDFARQFQVAVTDALIGSLDTSASSVKTIMDTADENGGFAASDFDTLAQDDTFTKWMADNSMTMVDIVSATYTEQYNIMSKYYSDLTQMQYEAFETQKENYESDVAEYQAILDYKRSLDAGATESANAVKEAWGDRIDFEAYASMDISDVEDKLAEAQAGIEEMTNKQYEINMSWDGIDQLEKSFDEMGDFASMMEKDVKKVGNSYQMTAAQGKKWMEMYPELFATASVTTDGLIQLSESEYEAFAAAEKQKRDEAIQTEINNMKLRLEEIPAERAKLETELQMYTSLAEGKMNLEGATAENLAEVRKNLTQFYIDSGVDEATANAEALKQMGLSQEEYNKLVADSSETNSKNMTDSVKNAVDNVKKLFYNLLANLKNVFSNLGKAIKAIFTGDWDSISGYITDAWNGAKGAVEGVKNDYNAIKSGTIDNYKIGNSYTGYATQADFEQAQRENLDSIIENVNASIAKLDNEANMLTSKITYLEAMKKQDVSEFGSTDPDDVDETDKDKDKDKESKDLLELTERYHELTREVAALEHQLELVSKQKDRAFGAKKIQAIEKEIKAMEDLVETQQDLYKAQLVFLAIDKQNVTNTFGNAQFKDNGEIANYSDLAAQAAAELNAARTAYSNSAQEDADKDTLEAAEKRYEDQVAILEQYEETLDKTRESEKILNEAFDNWQAAHFEKFSYKLELEIELNEDDLQRLDYYLSKTEDDFYSRGEALALMSDKVGIYTDSLVDNKTAYAELQAIKAAGQINDEQYIEGLDSISDNLYSNLEALNELDDAMMNYYGETIAMAQEELDKTTTQLEKQTSVLEHYMTILELMGKSTDYKKVGVILEGQAETTKNEMIAAQKEYELFAKEAEENYLKWQSAKTEEEAELYRKQYEASLAAADEAQEEFLSKAEAYGEALKAILENDLNQYAQDLENILTGGTSFDQMTTAMERAASLQEEYLTTTNKIYETNKLMNQAQQEIDKSNNTVAKQRLKQFIDETNQLQKKNKLSQYELEIQQAKYELLLAEIALEDAQSAKSQVRLQRDAEGNFGYVYTADQEKVNSAAQELADAQNELYNIALEGANDYAEKYQQTLNEMYDTLRDLHQQYLDGEFESEEEYQNAVLEAKKYYFDLLEDYSDLYTIAISTDARALEDSWTKEFNTMIFKTDEWRDKTEIYIQKVQDAFNRWDTQMDKIASATGVGGDLEDLEKSVSKITDESKSLIDTLTSPGGVIDAIQQEITTVKSATDAYALQRKEVQKLISDYEKLTDSILESKKAMAKEKEKESTTKPPASTGGGGGNNTGGSGTTGGGGAGTGGDGTPKKGDKVIFKSGKYYNSSDGQSPLGSKYLGEEVYITNINKRSWATHPYHISKGSTLGSGDLGWLKLDQISGYDTGGYTGSWGPYGKLAMLHEKELVLNSGDTENFLAGMQILDNIIQTIDLHTANTQLGRALQSPGFGGIGTDTLEQQVTIEANFPSVTSRTEIEEAFTTLVNRASQYANRK